MKRFRTLAVCAAAAVLALGLAACNQSNSNQEPADSSTSAETSQAVESAPAPTSTTTTDTSADTSAAPASGPGAAGSSGGAANNDNGTSETGFDFVDECTDEHGNITLYALTELKGWQVATLLDQQKYEWNDKEVAWVRPMDGAAFTAYKETGVYTIDTYNEMNEKGGAIAAVGFNIVAGYPDSQAALKGNAQCVVEDSYFLEDGSGVAIFYGPSMKEYLAIISPYSESTTQFMIFSQEAVGSGMADELLGGETGGTFQALWQKLTSEDHYGA